MVPRQTPDERWTPENLKFFSKWNVLQFINFIRKICKCSAENPNNGPERFLGEIQNKVDKTNANIVCFV